MLYVYLIGLVLGIAILLVAFLKAILRGGRPSKRFEVYEHHGTRVHVRQDLRGKHRDHCLCYDCSRFHPGDSSNCPIAQKLYAICVEHDLVTPVWECRGFTHHPYAVD